MPIIKSAKKRLKITKKKTARNVSVKVKLKDSIKTANKALATKSSEADKLVKEAQSQLDRAASKKIIHKNTAARKKSRLAKALKEKGLSKTKSEKEKK